MEQKVENITADAKTAQPSPLYGGPPAADCLHNEGDEGLFEV